MTQEEPFLMISLKDDKTKKLAHALTNKSANKILTYLASHKGASEQEIAKNLKIPVSTVNYTMKVLVDAKLVTTNEYHYSSKGREVTHYALARKYIIIAPQEEQAEGFLERLKTYLPASLLAISATAITQLLFTTTQGATSAGLMHTESADMMRMTAVEETTTTTSWYEPLLTLDWAGPALIAVFFFLTFILAIDKLRRRN